MKHGTTALKKLLLGKDLTEKESFDIFLPLFQMKLSKSDAKSLLLLLAQKGESSAEVIGCLKALRSLEPEKNTRIPGLMDTCGTGGDQSHSINVSTLSAILIATAGGKVAKHGNRSITSKVGSSDLMRGLGVNLDAAYSKMLKAIKEVGIGYFHAPLYHPIFARVQPLRQELKARTIFNLLGPLVNPLKLERQIIGVSNPKYLDIFAKVQKSKELKRALVCHSLDGMDEISTSAKSELRIITGSKITKQIFDPRKYGFKKARLTDYAGGSLKKNLSISKRILQGKLRGPQTDLVVSNAGVGLYVSGVAKNIDAGIERIQEVVNKGAAMKTVQDLVRICK